MGAAASAFNTVLSKGIEEKYASKVRKDQAGAEFFLKALHDKLTNPDSPISDDAIDVLMKGASGFLPKEQGQILKEHVGNWQAKKALEKQQAALQGSQPVDRGVPQIPAVPPPPQATGTGGAPFTPMRPEAAPALPPLPSPASPLPPAPNPIAVGSAQSSQGFSLPPMPTSGPAPTLGPGPFLQDPGEIQRRQIERSMSGARQIGLTDPVQIANFVSGKQVDWPSATQSRWQSAGPGIIYNSGTGEYMQITKPEEKLYEVNGKLVNTSGQVIYDGPLPAKDPTSAFMAAKQQREAELGRALTSEELIALERSLSGGEPLYPVVEGNNVVYRPRGQAAGASAPRTLYDLSGTPSLGGQPGRTTFPPAPLPEGAQESISGLKTTIGQFNNVSKMLADPKFSTLGPVVGRIKLVEFNRLGGAGATPEQIELATTLRRLMATQAFDMGGKQLTPTEKIEFQAISPNLEDTLQSAVIKTRSAIKYLNDKYRDRVSVMSPTQRGQLPPPPSAAAPNGAKIRVRRKSDGRTGTVSESAFDPAKYERIQ